MLPLSRQTRDRGRVCHLSPRIWDQIISDTVSHNQKRTQGQWKTTSSFIPDTFCQAWMGAKNHHIVSLLGGKRPARVTCLSVPVPFQCCQKIDSIFPCGHLRRERASLPAQPVSTVVGMRAKTLPKSGKKWKTSLEGLPCSVMLGCSLIKLLTSEHRSAEFAEVVRAG